MYDGQVVQPKAKIREVQSVVAALHDLPIEAMWSKSRQHKLAHPRQEAMALARELTGRSFPEIGLMFGGKDHTTILYAHRKVAKLAETDSALAERLALARARIAELVAERVASQPVATSTSWQPPAPLRPAKPVRISVRIDLDAWARLGGEVVA